MTGCPSRQRERLQLCKHRLDTAIERVLTAQSDDSAVQPTWAKVDRAVTELAPWVPLVDLRAVVVVSKQRATSSTTRSGAHSSTSSGSDRRRDAYCTRINPRFSTRIVPMEEDARFAYIGP